mgnify:CR=1 FL=1
MNGARVLTPSRSAMARMVMSSVRMARIRSWSAATLTKYFSQGWATVRRSGPGCTPDRSTRTREGHLGLAGAGQSVSV